MPPNRRPVPNPVAGRAVVLLSGGVDSATTLALARHRGYLCFCLSFDYGQRHRSELEAARRVARALGTVEHRIVTLEREAFRGSALTGSGEVPKRSPDHPSADKIPDTYVPARNTIFLAFALGWAEVLGAQDIFIGANAVDYSGYPDCRPEYIEAFQRMANLATRAAVEAERPVRVQAPLIDKTKAGIIRTGHELGVDYGLTLSCYDPGPDGLACGRCDSCLLRRRGFVEAGVPDPTPYQQPA